MIELPHIDLKLVLVHRRHANKVINIDVVAEKKLRSVHTLITDCIF